MNPLNTFFSRAVGPFVNRFLDFCPRNQPYILEKAGDMIRFYSKNGNVTEWSGPEDGETHLIQKAIDHELYKEIPFPSDFSSKSLMIA